MACFHDAQELCCDVANDLVKRGWELYYEGITINDNTMICEPCSREGFWYNVQTSRYLVVRVHCLGAGSRRAVF